MPAILSVFAPCTSHTSPCALQGLAESSEAQGRRQGVFGCVRCIPERMAPPPPASHLLPSWQSEVWGDYASRVKPTNADVANAEPVGTLSTCTWGDRYLLGNAHAPPNSLLSACRRLPSRLRVGQHGDAGIRKRGRWTAGKNRGRAGMLQQPLFPQL